MSAPKNPGECYQVYCDLALQVLECHSYYIQLVKQVCKNNSDSWEGNQNLSMGRVAKTLWPSLFYRRNFAEYYLIYRC